ncbi:hypothetical protein Aduo_014991 [Ancylostoma duodenale]
MACTSTKVSSNFTATPMYEMKPGSKDLCLTACYEESGCTFVEYFQDFCTLYRSGSEDQFRRDNVFEIDRQLARRSCMRKLLVKPTVEFKPIAEDKNDNMTCSGHPNFKAAVNMFIGRDNLRFYTTNESMFSDGKKAFRRFL